MAVFNEQGEGGFHRTTISNPQIWYSGSRSWIRTTIDGFKGRCPTFRRSGIFGYIHRVVLPIFINGGSPWAWMK